MGEEAEFCHVSLNLIEVFHCLYQSTLANRDSVLVGGRIERFILESLTILVWYDPSIMTESEPHRTIPTESTACEDILGQKITG